MEYIIDEYQEFTLLFCMELHYKNTMSWTYRKICNIRRTQNQNLNDSRLIMQLPLPNPLKPGVKSRVSADRRWSNYTWVINNFIAI